ncbi:glycosyltransferase [Candidatus Pacearchaeota archaeon]|nr:glycosyltransferase [Candidatus Pacearchaeota archaeon]
MKKVNKILFAETPNKYYFLYPNWYLALERHCNNLIAFDPKFNYFKYGKDKMNQMFLEVVEREKPDFIFMCVRNEEFYLSTLLKIREISPNTKTMLYFGDDDAAFEAFSRYYILFLDLGLVFQRKYLKEYKKDGIKNIFFTLGLNTKYFRHLNLKKEYDVTFIGHPKTSESERYELIKFLKDKGVKLTLFGWGWDNYPEFKEIYKGALDSDKMVEVINQSKITLCFSHNHFGIPHMKGKFFEGSSCKTFVLTGYCDEYPRLLKEGKEIIMYQDREDLLEKINYYLKHEKEREKIANITYKKIRSTYSLDKDLDKIITSLPKIRHNNLPKIRHKAISLSVEDLKKEKEKIIEKIKDFDYIYFKTKNSEDMEFREYLQIYSLEKTKKQISCCNYYVNSKYLGDYLYFKWDTTMNTLSKEDFNSFLDLSQIMMTKDFFINNLDFIKEIYNGKIIDFINKENTAFISFPLLRLKKISAKDYETMKKSFEFIFLFQLLSLKLQKKFFTLYPIALLFKILSGNKFILQAIIKNLKDQDKKNKIKAFSN